MQSTLRMQARVLPGNRIELIAPELREGETVSVLVVLDRPPEGTSLPMIDLIDSLPPGPRSAGSWPEVERHLQEERDSWDR